MSRGNQLLTKDEWNADIKRMAKEIVQEMQEEKIAKGKKPMSKKKAKRIEDMLYAAWSLG